MMLALQYSSVSRIYNHSNCVQITSVDQYYDMIEAKFYVAHETDSLIWIAEDIYSFNDYNVIIITPS